VHKLHVHVIGCGHAVALPLDYLTTHPDVGTVTVESRTEKRLRAIVDDLAQSLPESGRDIRIARIHEVQPDIIIIAYGRTIHPGEGREALFEENAAALVDRIGMAIRGDPFIVVVTNPVDPLTELLRRHLNLRPDRIVGIGGDLDASRVRWALPGPPAEITALGEHSEAATFLVDGVPLESCSDDVSLRARVRASLANQLEQLGAPTFCPGRAIVRTLESFIGNQDAMFHLSVYHDAYGTVVTWPANLGRSGCTPVPMVIPDSTAAAVAHIARRNLELVDGFFRERRTPEQYPARSVAAPGSGEELGMDP
jgi:malate/lactate dehydrogenase